VIIGFGSIKLDDPDVLNQIDAFYKAGFKGIGEITRPLKDYNDSSYFPIYERIQLYGMHIMFHTGVIARRNPEIPQISGMSRMRPSFLDEIARRFPKLTIQGAHLGNPWYAEAAEAARWNPNLYFDITGSSLIKKKDHPEFWSEILWWRPSLETRHSPSAGEHAFEKIVFGTDESPEGLLPNIERFDTFLKANRVPEDIQEKCWCGTMCRILGIDCKK
jgi:predicted TIM-barrel fold metal-dependent hydrolase